MNAPLVLTPPTSPRPPLPTPTAPVLTFEPTAQRGPHPHLECLLAPALNRHVEHAHEHSQRWVVDMGLVELHGAALERCLGARFAWLGARSYPSVSCEELCLVSDWLSFLFFYDDLCDTRAVNEGLYREDLEALERGLIAVAHGAKPEPDDDVIAWALADIRRRVSERAEPSWVHLFASHFEEYVEGVRWERLLRLQARVPALATYARLRPLSSAVFPCFALAGIFIDGDDPSFADDVYVRQLEVMANNHVSWVNDIYGIDKELREQTNANLVVVLAQEHGLAWEEAIDRAIAVCNAELQAFLLLSGMVAARTDHRGRAYVGALAAWMRGNLDWYADTNRYSSDRAVR